MFEGLKVRKADRMDDKRSSKILLISVFTLGSKWERKVLFVPLLEGTDTKRPIKKKKLFNGCSLQIYWQPSERNERQKM